MSSGYLMRVSTSLPCVADLPVDQLMGAPSAIHRHHLPSWPDQISSRENGIMATLVNLVNMGTKLKEHLIQIADRLTSESTLEDVYEQLALLADIEISEQQEEDGQVLTQSEVELQSREWLK